MERKKEKGDGVENIPERTPEEIRKDMVRCVERGVLEGLEELRDRTYHSSIGHSTTLLKMGFVNYRMGKRRHRADGHSWTEPDGYRITKEGKRFYDYLREELRPEVQD